MESKGVYKRVSKHENKFSKHDLQTIYLITFSFTVDLVFGRRKLLKLVLFGSLIIKGNVGSKRKKKSEIMNIILMIVFFTSFILMIIYYLP